MSQAKFKVIGTRPIRHDGADKVTGRALYGADLYLAGMLHGRILRSPHAHAKIKKIDARKALAPGAPLLHPNLRTEALGKQEEKPSNVAKHFQFKLGDIDNGFREAAVMVERQFHTATVHQGYIEPHNATALWNADGNVTIW